MSTDNKTAMQMLIDEIKSKQIQGLNDWQYGYQKALNDLLYKATELKETVERGQLVRAWMDGGSMLSCKNATQYYETTYGTSATPDEKVRGITIISEYINKQK